MLLDGYLPEYDVVERHEIDIPRSPRLVWGAVQQTDFAGSAVIRWLFRLRGMAARTDLPRPLTLSTLERWRFSTLEEDPPKHIVIGLVGRFWTPTGGLLRIDKQMFLEKPGDGLARAAWSFELEPIALGTTRLWTETRVQASDDRSRRSFRRYWRLVGPCSALIRREMLRRVKRRAMATAGTPSRLD